MRLVCEPGSRERGAGKKRVGAGIVVRNSGIVVRNPKIDKFHQKLFNVNFKNLILVKLGTYYSSFRRAYCHPKLKKVLVREREN